MKVVFRADASLQIGTGHVMRCLTLADSLTAKGAECKFICRAHEGHLGAYIQQRGFQVHLLQLVVEGDAENECQTAHSSWLGVSMSLDAQETGRLLADLRPDWLVVDHYALDARWEGAQRGYVKKLLVIDDLADRLHDCDMLLDQNLGRQLSDYDRLVPSQCIRLIGPHYALLRPEFAQLRSYSLQRRTNPSLRELLITMGGVDKDNATGQVLEAIVSSRLPVDCRITIVMGSTSPWLEAIQEQAEKMPWLTRVLVGVSNMGQLMADSDLAIGAAGATSWERCCLGLPAIMLVLADNQQFVAEKLAETGAALSFEAQSGLDKALQCTLSTLSNQCMLDMVTSSSMLVDGLGVLRVAEMLKGDDE